MRTTDEKFRSTEMKAENVTSGWCGETFSFSDAKPERVSFGLSATWVLRYIRSLLLG